MNPYDWQNHSLRTEISRMDADRVAATLRHGGSAVVRGGRGMGVAYLWQQRKPASQTTAT